MIDCCAVDVACELSVSIRQALSEITLSFFFSSRRRHTRCALVTGVQTCALPILVADAPHTALPHHAEQPLEAAHLADLLHRVGHFEVHLEEIGRASCRERVCQYV